MNNSDIERRLERLEETAAFNDRAVELLGQEVASAFRRLQDLARRLESLEKRAEAAANAPAGADSDGDGGGPPDEAASAGPG